MNVIEAKNVTKKYLRKEVLSDVSFSIKENTITGLIGRNGAGKTTLLKLIAGFLKNSSGDLNVFAQKPFESLYVSENSIFADDRMGFSSALKLGDILDAGAVFYPNWDQDLAHRLFEYFQFDYDGYHNRLSKGRMSTFNMIVGISSRCPLTIFDEPTTGMDASTRKDFYRAVLRDYLDFPRTILVSSHHLEELEDILEDVLILNNGRVHSHMPISDLKEWGLAVKGKREDVSHWLEDQEVIYHKSAGDDFDYVIVKNQGQSQTVPGLVFSSVSATEMSIHLTGMSKGGIDHVFASREIK
ncbi:ATP-binding cassette domain-containing protein [Bacillus mesophilum]|uniref:ABC transporter ATP-binding protein n=1 Tax=Bacillus mesophilum TaxID=1071718 RepID=A0A7V7RIZ9_9BACI|nr:ABC transporter ATP-binding protein [Bacillus mesophilum]KAB2330616.1 ABC transporter ATP-binding protein [Bacillus mesophilum]